MYLRVVLPDTVSGLLGLEGIFGDVADGLAGAFSVTDIMLIMAAFAGPWAKREITTAFVDRIAVSRVGPFGPLTIVMDAVRLLLKKPVVPEGVDHSTWDLAPMVIPFSALFGLAVILVDNSIQLADPEVDLIFTFAAVSIVSSDIVMTDYASNNKFSLIGAFHVVVANIAYKISLVVTAASVVILVGPLRISGIVAVQAEPLFSVTGVAIPTWFASVNPFAFALSVTVSLAEVGRNLLDIPEVPTKTVVGYQTEYSSVCFVLIYLGEFIHIFLGGTIATTLLLGDPAGLVLPGFVWFTAEIQTFFLFTRRTRPVVLRLRVGQSLETGWERMPVLSLASLVPIAIIVRVITQSES